MIGLYISKHYKMKKLFYAAAWLLVIAMVTGCGSVKTIPYLVDSAEITEEEYATQTTPLYDARIMPKDILTITVSTTDPEASKPFNVTVPLQRSTDAVQSYTTTQLNTYLVDNAGEIDFPVLGMISLKGLTNREAEQKLRGLLQPYIKEYPLVSVKFGNYTISVLGEVARPGSFTVGREKVNLLEALAMAGDMTIYGKRENVKIIREDALGNKSIIEIDMNNPYLIFMPEYYLQQNDVVYVEPNKVKAKNSRISQSTTIWFSVLSTAVTVASLLINILK